MSQQCSWPTHSWPLEGRCLYHTLLGLTQAPGFAGGHDSTQKGIAQKFLSDILKTGQRGGVFHSVR